MVRILLFPLSLIFAVQSTAQQRILLFLLSLIFAVQSTAQQELDDEDFGALVKFLVYYNDADEKADLNNDAVVDQRDYTVFVQSLNDDINPPEPPEPPTPPISPEVGEFGDEWPTPHGQGTILPGDNSSWDRGRINNLKATKLTLVGFTWDGDGSNYALKLTNVGGPDKTTPLIIDFIGCVFKDAGQGFALNWDDDTETADVTPCFVRFINCHFVDCYQPGNTEKPAELGIFHNARDTSSLIGVYGCSFVNMGYDGTAARRLDDASVFDHGGYPDGNSRVEVLDSVFINCASHAFKGPSVTVKFKRNAVFSCAIGFSVGMDLDQQNETGAVITKGIVQGNLFYELDDLQQNNQRLGMGVWVQSAEALIDSNIFTTPATVNQNNPAVRADRIANKPVSIKFSNNIVLGYKTLIEAHGYDQPWDVPLTGDENIISEGTAISFDRKKGRVIVSSEFDAVTTTRPPLEFDVESITRDVLSGDLNAAGILALAHSKLE